MFERNVPVRMKTNPDDKGVITRPYDRFSPGDAWYVKWEREDDELWVRSEEIELNPDVILRPDLAIAFAKLMPYITAEDNEYTVLELAQIILDRVKDDVA